jgi:uncharacterized protein with NRDE domain
MSSISPPLSPVCNKNKPTAADKKYNYEGAGKELEKHIVMTEGTIEQRIAYINKEYDQREALQEKKSREQEQSQNKIQEQKPDILKQAPQQKNTQKPDTGYNYGMGG